MCIFFFSSRRRHTRPYGDWSSDVCSSDLRSGRLALPRRACHGRIRGGASLARLPAGRVAGDARGPQRLARPARGPFPRRLRAGYPDDLSRISAGEDTSPGLRVAPGPARGLARHALACAGRRSPRRPPAGQGARTGLSAHRLALERARRLGRLSAGDRGAAAVVSAAVGVAAATRAGDRRRRAAAGDRPARLVRGRADPVPLGALRTRSLSLHRRPRPRGRRARAPRGGDRGVRGAPPDARRAGQPSGAGAGGDPGRAAGGRRRRAVGDVPLTVAGVLRPRPRMLRIGTVIAPYDRMLRLALLGLVTTWLTTLVRLMRSSRAAVPAPAGERALPQRGA